MCDLVCSRLMGEFCHGDTIIYDEKFEKEDDSSTLRN